VGTLVTFTATVGGGSPAITYTWDFGDGIPRIGQVVDYIFNAAGTFSVTLTVSNCDGANTASISHDVTVSDVCVPVTGPDFTWAPLTPTAGDSVTFTSSIAGGSLPIAYNWDFGDGSTGTGANPEHTFASSGTYSVTLTVSNCGGSSTDFITKDVTVLPPESGVTIYLPLIVR
jgi:PKD repeat protein